jgi:hypothetical protein
VLASSGYYGNSIDWTSNGDVDTSAWDMGSCNSAWAFAVAAAIQSANSIQRNNKTPLSVQQMVSCMGQDYFTPDGCAGGNIAAAMLYTLDNPLMA